MSDSKKRNERKRAARTPPRRSRITSIANCSRFSRERFIGFLISDYGIADFKIWAPSLSARVMMMRASFWRDARIMAPAIFLGLRRVIAQMAEPDPLKKAPRGPAFSAERIVYSRNGTDLLRNG